MRTSRNTPSSGEHLHAGAGVGAARPSRRSIVAAGHRERWCARSRVGHGADRSTAPWRHPTAGAVERGRPYRLGPRDRSRHSRPSTSWPVGRPSSSHSSTGSTRVSPSIRCSCRFYPHPEDLEPARRHLTLFLIQYWGGPTTYSDERGHPRAAHAPRTVRHRPGGTGPAGSSTCGPRSTPWTRCRWSVASSSTTSTWPPSPCATQIDLRNRLRNLLFHERDRVYARPIHLEWWEGISRTEVRGERGCLPKCDGRRLPRRDGVVLGHAGIGVAGAPCNGGATATSPTARQRRSRGDVRIAFVAVASRSASGRTRTIWCRA